MPDESVARACATSGSAVVFAGGTVVIALCSLSVARHPDRQRARLLGGDRRRCRGRRGAHAAAGAAGVLGQRIESPAVPTCRPPAHDDQPHGWARWARGVGERAPAAMALAIAILLALAMPVLDIRLGQQDNGQFPKSTRAPVLRPAHRGLRRGVNGPLLVAVEFDPQAAQRQEEAQPGPAAAGAGAAAGGRAKRRSSSTPRACPRTRRSRRPSSRRSPSRPPSSRSRPTSRSSS